MDPGKGTNHHPTFPLLTHRRRSSVGPSPAAHGFKVRYPNTGDLYNSWVLLRHQRRCPTCTPVTNSKSPAPGESNPLYPAFLVNQRLRLLLSRFKPHLEILSEVCLSLSYFLEKGFWRILGMTDRPCLRCDGRSWSGFSQISRDAWSTHIDPTSPI